MSRDIHDQEDGGLKGRAPVDHRALRRHNLGLILQHVADNGPRSRATIANETGLNKTTVSSLVGELIEQRLLRETTVEHPGAVGRPGRNVEVSGDGVAALGLEVASDYLAAIAIDLAGGVRHMVRVTRNNDESDPTTVIAELGVLARGALDALDADGLTAVGATLALPALVDKTGQTVFVAHGLDWHDLPAADLVAQQLARPGLRVRVDNDVNLAAVGESFDRAGQVRQSGLRDFVCVYGSGVHGLGAGIVTDGRLFRGAHGFGGLFGHLAAVPGGILCHCGNRGCLSTLTSALALSERAGMDADDVLRVGVVDAVTQVVQRAQRNDRVALDAIAETRTWLAFGLRTLANLLNPDAIVLGGWYTIAASFLERPLEEELGIHMVGGAWSSCRVLTSTLERNGALHGAAALQLRDVLADPESALAPLASPG